MQGCRNPGKRLPQWKAILTFLAATMTRHSCNPALTLDPPPCHRAPLPAQGVGARQLGPHLIAVLLGEDGAVHVLDDEAVEVRDRLRSTRGARLSEERVSGVSLVSWV